MIKNLTTTEKCELFDNLLNSAESTDSEGARHIKNIIREYFEDIRIKSTKSIDEKLGKIDKYLNKVIVHHGTYDNNMTQYFQSRLIAYYFNRVNVDRGSDYLLIEGNRFYLGGSGDIDIEQYTLSYDGFFEEVDEYVVLSDEDGAKLLRTFDESLHTIQEATRNVMSFKEALIEKYS